MPELMVGQPPFIQNLREASIRMQADLLVIFSTAGDLYSRYKLFSKTDLKAFSTTQVVLLDTRTALVPFTCIVTKDALSSKQATDLDEAEARMRVQYEALKLTLEESGRKIISFLSSALTNSQI